jgi:hypothetical protein
MTRLLKRLYHFLGSVYCAILLIASSAAFVVVGTLLESKTESHRFAAHFTYGNPIFVILLWLFFINILVSALRRWPFKPKHIPFLTTHCGLLMILAGCLIKSYYGVQGTMTVLEGSASQQITIADTYAIRVDRRDPKNFSGQVRSVRHYPLNRSFSGVFERHLTDTIADQEPPFAEIDLSLIAYSPHSQSRVISWIKGDHAVIKGLKPFKVHDWPSSEVPLPIGTRAFVYEDEEPWSFYAFRSDDVEKVAEGLQKQSVADRRSAIAIVQEPSGDEHLLAVNAAGQICRELFHPQALHSVVSYAGGFGGYAAEAVLSLSAKPPLHLECPLTFEIKSATPGKKLEENIPQLTLAIVAEGQRELVTLAYDAHAKDLKQPALGGRYLFRFQPEEKTIPYRVRLRDARQINYPNTNQPYSFESDLIITDTRDQTVVEKTISMNNVHETWDGYRFYLANIAPGEEIAPQRIQLVVNRDPAKYFLTYPGAMIVAMGIVMLFWLGRGR